MATVPGQPRLTVVVLNYNGRALLEAMLSTLQSQRGPLFRTVVVDNGSSDQSLDFLRAQWPDVEVVALEQNIGVTAALNRGLAAVATEFVALFNNDMELEPDCLNELTESLLAHPEAGSATPKMLDHTDRTRLDGAGDLLSWRGGGRRRGHGDLDRGQYDEPGEVFGPCGGAAMFRLAALDRVGLLDESYYAYYEDIDWAFRAQLAGYSCRYAPRAVLYHHGSATLGRGFNDFNAYHLWRNPIWLVAKCYPARSLLRHLPDIVRGQLGNLYTAARERKLLIWLRAVRDAARGMPDVWRRRRAVQSSRAITGARLEQAARAGRLP